MSLDAPPPDVVVLPTGVANTASVLAALRRLGAAPRLCEAPAEARAAGHLVLPGVGSFGAAMERLHALGLVEVLRERIAANRPTLAVCVGLQVLAEASEESPGVAGLGVLPGTVRRFPSTVRVPQFGWNRVIAHQGAGFVTSGAAYYANSYRLPDVPPPRPGSGQAGWRAALSDHGGPFVAALERGRVLACQFHPELSGAFGLGLLERWLHGAPVVDDATVPAQGAAAGLARRIIPCLDVRDGRVVKGVRFQGLTEAGDPAELAAAYEAQGADELVLLDVSATPEGRKTAHETVRRVRARLSIPLSVGGGVQSGDDAGRLLDAGADKVGVNTAAVRDPRVLTDIATRFGRQCAVLALDAARRPACPEQGRGEGGWEVVVLSGKERTGMDAIQWARRAVEAGAGEILLTSWDRDGTRLGYDLELMAAVAAAVPVPVIASGGVDSPQHLLEGLRAGADAVLAASIFHYGEHTVAGVKDVLAAAGLEMRR